MARIHLHGTYNTRDLGGFQTNDQSTRIGRFLRSDSITGLSHEDIEALSQIGIKVIIDLRMPEEIEKAPNPLSQHPAFTYYHIPLMDNPTTPQMFDVQNIPEDFLSTLYIQLIEESKPHIKTMFDVFDKHSDGLLFHCTAGKDRTGVTAMLLLGLAGVSEADIVADYQVSYTYIKHDPRVQTYMKHAPQHLFYTHPEYIERTLTHIKTHYGSIPDYLKSVGIDQSMLDRIRTSMV